MQVSDFPLYSTQQHFTSDLYSHNQTQQSTVTIHEVSDNGGKRKVMVAFTDDPTEIKTLALASDVHSEFRLWTEEYEVSSVKLPDPPKNEPEGENRETSSSTIKAPTSTTMTTASGDEDSKDEKEQCAATESVLCAIDPELVE